MAGDVGVVRNAEVVGFQLVPTEVYEVVEPEPDELVDRGRVGVGVCGGVRVSGVSFLALLLLCVLWLHNLNCR